MLCPKCGWTNPDYAANCANCQAGLTRPMQPQPAQQSYAPTAMQRVPNYLAWSIVVTVASAMLGMRCCISLFSTAFGIVAIVKSSQANTKSAVGDFAGAMQDANAAKTWMLWAAAVCAVSIVLTVIFVILYFVFVLLMMHHTPSGSFS